MTDKNEPVSILARKTRPGSPASGKVRPSVEDQAALDMGKFSREQGFRLNGCR